MGAGSVVMGLLDVPAVMLGTAEGHLWMQIWTALTTLVLVVAGFAVVVMLVFRRPVGPSSSRQDRPMPDQPPKRPSTAHLL